MPGEQKNDGATYVPRKVKDLARELVASQDIDAVLARLRDEYPTLTTRRTAFSMLKAAVLDHRPQPRHAEYPAAMQAWRLGIEEDVVATKGAPASLRRLQEFQAFQDCTLKRQLMLQKKFQLGHGLDFFSDPRDAEQATHIPLLPDYVRRIQLSALEVRTIQEDQARKMRQLASDVVRIDDAEAVVLNARRVLRNAPHETELALATALAVATGRRMFEIFAKGRFLELPGQRYELRFQGQAKAGLQEMVSLQEDKRLEYTIPVLAPAPLVLQGVQALRDKAASEGMHAKTVNSRFCRRLNAFVKTAVHETLGFHDLRTMYALLSFEAFKPHTYSINAWVSKCLGHVGLGMSVSYTRMQLYGIRRIQRHAREAAEDLDV